MTSLDRLVAEGAVVTDVPLASLTTYKLGGPARYFAEVADEASLAAVAGAWRSSGLPVLVVGRGSNLVVADRGFDGLVMHLTGAFNTITHGPDTITAGGAVPLPALARDAVHHGRLGLEFYVGIPGSVGGAVRQNAGCHGTETVDRLVTATVVDLTSGDRTDRDGDQLELSYRHSNLRTDEVVLSARFDFVEGDPATGEATMREVTRWRRSHQPGGTFNAGSVFKNPPGDAAGRIIDAAGLKGFAVGGAAVSDKHANFFVAEPGTTAADVHRLVWEVRRRVAELTGVTLEPEIRFVGEFEDR